MILLILVVFSLSQFLGDNRPGRESDFRRDTEEYLAQYRDAPMEQIIGDIEALTHKDGNIDFRVVGVAGSEFYHQAQYIQGFPAYLAGIQKRAAQMGTVSIFANADPGIEKTAADYARLEGLTLSVGHDRPVTSVMSYSLSDWLLAGYMLVIVLSFLSERRRGLWNVVCASPRGRVTLALWRLVSLFLAALTGGVLFTGTEVLCAYAVHGGFEELGRVVQSISIFQSLTIPMTVGQFWLFYAGLRIAGAMVLGMVLWLLFQLISDRRMATISTAVFVGAQWALHRFLSEGRLLKVVNLFTYLSPREMVLEYTNVLEFGSRIGHLSAALVFGAAICVVGCAIVFFCAKYRKPSGNYGWLSKLLDRWRRLVSPLGYHVSQFFHETHKLLIVGRGLLLVLIAMCLAFSIAERPFLNDNWVSTELEALFRQSQGPLAEGRAEYVAAQEDKLLAAQVAVEELQAQYQAGEITASAYESEMMYYSNLDKQLVAFEDYKTELAVLQEMGDSYIVPHWVYAELFCVSGDTVRSLQFLCLLTVLLMSTLYMAAEAQTGMTRSRRATARGRSPALLARHGAGWLVSTIVTVAAFGLQFFLLRKSYGTLPLLEAPVKSLIYFRNVSGSFSILGYWLAKVGVRVLAMCGWSSLLLYVGDRLQK